MRWERSDFGKIFLCLMAISAMLGLCNQMAEQKAGSVEALFTGEEIFSAGEFQTADAEEEKMIAITFDDGPNGVYTEQLLEGLAERNVKVTFFLIGKNAEAHPELVQRIAEEGHMIGNHTYSHLQLTAGNVDQFLEELQRTNEIIEEITGERPIFCRPPFGAWNKSFEEQLGIIPVLWDVDPKDWCTFDTQTVTNRILQNCHDNAIILLHDEYKTSVEAALLVIDELQRQGYTFVTVDQIVLTP